MASFIIRYKKGILAFALFFPFLLNFLVALPTPEGWRIAGNSSDWLLFWVTYLSALASIAMVIAAYETLKESQKQWEEAHTAHISVMAYQDKYHQVFIRIFNTSSFGVIIQSLQLCQNPSDVVKNLFSHVKSNLNSDKYSQWQHIYENCSMVIRPYEYEDILILQNFPRQLDEILKFKIKFSNINTEVDIDLNDIVIIQNDHFGNGRSVNSLLKLGGCES